MSGPFCLYKITSIPARIRNHIACKVFSENADQFPNYIFDICEGINNFTQPFGEITDPHWD